MRIPLDYYRILGLPIQATAEQLQQAHRDRIQQLPRREFSEAALMARKQLLDQAYATLSDAARRQEYDASFLAKTYDLIDTGKYSDDQAGNNQVGPDAEGLDPYTPNIEIEQSQFAGALLIFLELGEYELVLRLGYPFLSNGSANLDRQPGNSDLDSTDIVLTVALAYLELGREQWQQGQYENAAISLENGQELLLREGVFANIRGEMQSDLFKLRPYRILELISLPDGQEEARRQGISLLEDMLHDRSGIDGQGDDLSGLGVDDFLRFIQQLRSYLTSTEQQMLFELEARRPSAVATYLAVYALLARGFAHCQPALIRRAKMMLIRLSNHQDVHLEQAVCSLLLGQTEEASRALELSQEFESIAFIRDHSQGSPDLLPGLCLYSERWFQNEVFPHFRDLQGKQASLTEYFADEDVQLYLEDLPADAAPAPTPLHPTTRPTAYPTAAPREVNLPADSRAIRQSYVNAAAGTTATIEAPDYAAGISASSAGRRSSEGHSSANLAAPVDSPTNSLTQPINSSTSSTALREQPPQPPDSQPSSNGTRPRRPARLTNLRLDRVLLLAALSLLGLLLLGILFGKLLNRPQTKTAASQTANTAQTTVAAEPGFSKFAQDQQKTIASSAPLTKDNAPEIVKAWLTAKAAAMGENHQIDELDKILVDPLLSQMKTRAEDAKANSSYWKLEHPSVEVVSVESSEPSPDSQSSASDSSTDSSPTPPTDSTDVSSSATPEQTETSPSPDSSSSTTDSSSTDADQSASIEALVTEKADFYTNGQIDSNASYNSTVRVRYDLERQDGEWRIRGMEVLQ